MATLTASGLNASDGTLNGQYTGTDSQASSLPIGSLVWTTYDFGSLPGRVDVNSTVPYIKYYTLNNYFRVGYAPSSAASLANTANLAGTWRNRGANFVTCGGLTYNILAQRVA
jgi:hypothetical protein